MITVYSMKDVPAHLKKLVETLIINADVFEDGYDTPANLADVAHKLYNVVVQELHDREDC